MSNSKKVALPGSERSIVKGAHSIGRTNPQEMIEISIVLKRKQPLTLEEGQGQTLDHAQLKTRYGADPSDIEKVSNFAAENGLTVFEHGDEVARRTLTIAGTAQAMEDAFDVELHDYQHDNGSYRGRTGTIQIPEDLVSSIQGVFGLDDRPVAHPHFRIRSTNGGAFGVRASNVSYTPPQIAKLYDFPAGDGAGQTIGLIELGGGFRPADIKEYFGKLGIKAPSVKSVSVDHAKNRPTTAQSADGEVMLDIEVAGAVAPGANIVVYFAPNTSRGFQDALSTAIHDTRHNPSVISISWGGPESTWTTQSMDTFDQVAQEAAALGITITVASGDNGSSDGLTDGANHVDFPASSPHVLAAGGTSLSVMSGRSTETVWNDGAQGGSGGGGYSTYFERPTWQSAVVTQSYRGVPDVAGDADPETGYDVLVDGQSLVIGGTSAVAPLWAGLVALLNASIGLRQGFINPALYAIDQTDSFRDITVGNNGAYSARPGWDAATGLGSPIGAKLLQAIQSKTAKAETPKNSQTYEKISTTA